jgi:large subunit ribosomal protein L4e
MKAALYSKDGKKKSEIELPEIFNTKIRKDLVQKYLEASKYAQPYGPSPKAGKQHSASGTISHKRHDWKGHYGRGLARLPRKTMWRRGTQFYWIGAEVSGTRGGRRAHPPKNKIKLQKINKKEIQMAMNSAIAATTNSKLIKSRYKNPGITSVIEELPEKTKPLMETLKVIFKVSHNKKKTIRSGKGKLRGRKYKTSPGILIIKSKDEKVKSKTLDIKSISEITIQDLYPLGRITLYTHKALEELN